MDDGDSEKLGPWVLPRYWCCERNQYLMKYSQTKFYFSKFVTSRYSETRHTETINRRNF